VNITDEDIRMIDEGMTKSSRFLHDVAGDVADPVPSPVELREDINNLETWVSQFRQHRD